METRERYAHTIALDTRWMDNDGYGHLNNVVYYSLFDTAVNRWLVDRQLLNITESPAIGLVVETGCRYLAPLSFPDRVTVGLRVAHLGTSSVRYELAIFRNDERTASAVGHFVHVYVDRRSRRPTPIPGDIRSALSTLQLTAEH
nr:thioesterase family protein [Gemmatimonas phototrophica]